MCRTQQILSCLVLAFLVMFASQGYAQEPDTTAPNFITGPEVFDVELNSANINWETDEPATALVEFGTDSILSESVEIAELAEELEVELQGLIPGMTYFFRVSVTDSSGNGPTLSDVLQFTTHDPEEGDGEDEDNEDNEDVIEDSLPLVKIVTGDVELAVADSIQLLAVYVDINGVEVDTTFDWSVSPDSIGSLNEIGLFTAALEGEGYIYAHLGALADSVEIEVSTEDGHDGNGDHGNGDDGSLPEGKFFVLPGDTSIEVGNSIQFTAHLKDTSGAVVDTVAAWSLHGDPIGTISTDGLLQVISPGVALVKAKLDNKEMSAMITAVDTSVDSSGVNTISISRVLPGGRVLPPQTINEGNVYVIGGLPYPLNILNGGQVYFPSGSLDKDITIHIKLPDFAQVKTDSVTFGEGIVAGVTFDVFVVDSLVSPFYFIKPLNVALPFKRGLLNKLGINPANLGLFFAKDGSFDGTGISSTVVDSSSNRIFSQVAHFSTLVIKETEITSHVDGDIAEMPEEFTLMQNYPNPFNPETNIQFRLSQASHVTLTIYNILGQKINTLVDKSFESGLQTIRWNGKDDSGRAVASGIYLYRIQAENYSEIRKMTLIR